MKNCTKNKREKESLTCSAIMLLSQSEGTIELRSRISIRQLYNSYELDLLTETCRLSIYNITRTYVCCKQTSKVPVRFNVCTYASRKHKISGFYSEELENSENPT